jgi:3-oxoacyl-[acyl-carrier-protein] synthase II
MEEQQHAIGREARIYGEVLGYGSLNEAFDFVEVDTSCETMALNLQLAIENASLDISQVDYINSHGNGIIEYDILETEAIKKAFGELAYRIPVSSVKPVTGHSISATGLWQTLASLLAIKNNIIPPTINVENPDAKCDLNYVSKGFVKKEVQTALINTHGFGGRLTSLIVKKFLNGKSVA